MKFEEACKWCHVRSSIYRKSNLAVKYNKNHTIPLHERVPLLDQQFDDWEEYDPADDYEPYYGMA